MKTSPLLINIPDHPDKSDKKNKKPGSDINHAKENQKLIQEKQTTKEIKREHGKTRKDMGK